MKHRFLGHVFCNWMKLRCGAKELRRTTKLWLYSFSPATTQCFSCVSYSPSRPNSLLLPGNTQEIILACHSFQLEYYSISLFCSPILTPIISPKSTHASLPFSCPSLPNEISISFQILFKQKLSQGPQARIVYQLSELTFYLAFTPNIIIISLLLVLIHQTWTS